MWLRACAPPSIRRSWGAGARVCGWLRRQTHHQPRLRARLCPGAGWCGVCGVLTRTARRLPHPVRQGRPPDQLRRVWRQRQGGGQVRPWLPAPRSSTRDVPVPWREERRAVRAGTPSRCRTAGRARSSARCAPSAGRPACRAMLLCRGGTQRALEWSGPQDAGELPVQVEKGMQGIDTRVTNPKGKGAPRTCCVRVSGQRQALAWHPSAPQALWPGRQLSCTVLRRRPAGHRDHLWQSRRGQQEVQAGRRRPHPAGLCGRRLRPAGASRWSLPSGASCLVAPAQRAGQRPQQGQHALLPRRHRVHGGDASAPAHGRVCRCRTP